MKIRFPLLSGEFLKKVYAKPRFNYCKLCLKNYISTIPLGTRKYKKSEFVSKRRHQIKLLIQSVSSKESMD